MTTKLNAFITSATEARANFKAEGKALLKEVFADFFAAHGDKYPAICWTQYTPYFNDGEACEFVFHGLHLGEGGEDDYDGEEGRSAWTIKYDGKKRPLDDGEKAFLELAEACESDALTDIFKEVFGDHVQVVATAAGFAVTEYEHD